MLGDKARHLAIEENQLGSQDRLLRWLVQDAEDNDLQLSVASQWPGRTMLVTRQDTFPLPPVEGLDGEAFLKNIEGITHLVFDPFAPENEPLANLLGTDRLPSPATIPPDPVFHDPMFNLPWQPLRPFGCGAPR